ncbi:MAG: ECF-type sigma factor [Acidobacteriota bacterium]
MSTEDETGQQAGADGSPAEPPGAATLLLRRLAEGESRAGDELLELLQDELSRLAAACFRRESPGHTLQPTALINEAWLRLVGSEQPNYENRSHFLGIAATVMRRVLVEHARRRGAEKRGGNWGRVTLDERKVSNDPPLGFDADVLALHQALERLAELSPRQATIVELRWFGGMTLREVAKHMGLVTRTVEKDWAIARAWLRRELTS